MKKKIIFITLILSLILLSVAPNQNTVSAESVKTDEGSLSNMYDSAVEGKTTMQDKTEFTSDDGKLINTVHSTITKEVIKNENDRSVTIKISVNDITTDANGKQIDNTFDTEEIIVNSNGEVTVNDNKVSPNELATELPAESVLENKYSTFAASGGKSYLTYYEDRGSRWFLGAYQKPTNNFLDNGSGTRRVRYPKSMTAGVSNFNSLARAVARERNDILEATALLLGALGTGALTWGTIIGALGAAGTAGYNAVKIYTSSSSGKKYMKQAWTQIGKL